MAEICRIPQPLSSTIEEAKEKRRMERTDYIILKTNTRDMRQTFLSDYTNTPINSREDEASRAIKQIIKREENQ